MTGRLFNALSNPIRRRTGARKRLELWFANEAMSGSRPPSGHTWQAIQRGLSELLSRPAGKRRAAIDLKPPGPDADEDAAVSMLSRYPQSLKPVLDKRVQPARCGEARRDTVARHGRGRVVVGRPSAAAGP